MVPLLSVRASLMPCQLPAVLPIGPPAAAAAQQAASTAGAGSVGSSTAQQHLLRSHLLHLDIDNSKASRVNTLDAMLIIVSLDVVVR